VCSLFHLGFFCHGCKDAGSSPVQDEFEHVLLQPPSPCPVFAPSDFANPRPLHGLGTGMDNELGLVEIDLGQKGRFVKVQHHQHSDGTISSPVIQFEAPAETRRSGYMGTPSSVMMSSTKSGPISKSGGEDSPFLKQQGREWI